MYHSTAILLSDGRALVGGSNPHQQYQFTNALYPTELRLEAFSPSYLDRRLSILRPNIMLPKTNLVMQYGKPMVVHFTVTAPVDLKMISVTMVAPPFNTLIFNASKVVGS